MFFSDGVFAIAITLLVIEIKIPLIDRDLSNSTLANALIQIIPKIIGFIISFILIGQTWIEHHRICLMIERYNQGLLWRNILLLLFVAFLPFTTGVMSEYYTLYLAVCLYAITFAALGVAKVSFWYHAVRHNLLARDVDRIQVKRISRRVWSAPVTCLMVIIAAISGIPYSYFGFNLIPVVSILLDRTASRK